MAFVTDGSGVLQERQIYREEVTVSYIYTGFAEPGTATSAATWSIQRETRADGTILYADGGNYSQIWDNRASLTYA